MKKILSISALLFVALSFAQTNLTTSENYIYSKTCLSGDCSKSSENVQYFDSWGKPIQTIDIKATPLERDMVSHIGYDQYGRQTISYLPVPQTGTQNGAIYTSPLANAPAVYGSEKISSEKILENSPLDRVQQQIQVGTAWSTKPARFDYDANKDGEVTKYTVTTSWLNGRTNYTVANSGTYSINSLAKNTVTNEDDNISIEFKNKKGQTILVRRKDGSQNVDTYYVYNEYGQLAYVIPPLAVQTGLLDQTTLNNLCYQYYYDGWNRAVEKKVPGKGWEYIVYDKNDRVLMTQDANMGASKQWLFTKYDLLGRVAFTGIYTSSQNYGSAGREAEQTLANNASGNSYESRNTGGFNATGVTAYYTNSAYPTLFTKILSINYYDTYPAGSMARPTQIFGENTVSDNIADTYNTQHLPTASYVKNIENDNWTVNYVWYDKLGRAIGTHSVNHLGGYTKTESLLDFTGIVKQSKVYHKRLPSNAEKIISQTFEYDNKNRLQKVWHTVDGFAPELLAENSYNELSQLSNKKVGNNLQSIDYAYNIRGALTRLNDPSATGKLFGYELKYYDPISTATGKRTGNISEVIWKTDSDNILRKYAYQYDALNRMTSGIFTEPNASIPQNNFYNETATYDLGGNIATLQRNGNNYTGTAQLIDNLSYIYIGNQLQTVTDSSGNYGGYPEASGNTMGYDDNGNMKNHVDKGILQIDYNFLNLPNYIKFDKTYVPRFPFLGDYNVNTKYLYRADGTKLQKIYTYGIGRANAEANTITEYLDGFQYEYEDTGDLFAPPVSPKFIPTSEGYYNFENNKYIYNYTDHLGNVRLSYTKNGSGTEIIEENNYYPFGLKHNISFSENPYKYQYNGKEVQQETGWNDFGARMYMSDIGRWGVVDPLAEQMRRHSPYNYAFNNPINFIDPDGMAPYDPRAMYGENSAFNGDFDPKTSIMGGDFFPGSNSFLNSFWYDPSGGGGGSSSTIGELMKSVGITLGSLESYMQLTTVLTLSQQLEKAGWVDSKNIKAKFDDIDILNKKLPVLSELLKITKAKFYDITGGTCPNKTEYQNILINMNNAQNILKLAFVIGHEMNHSFAQVFFADKFSEITRQPKSSIPFRNSFGFFQEVMGVTWEINLGGDRYGKRTGFEAAEFFYGPNGLGYSQKSVNTVDRYFYELKTAWNFMYKSKLK
ncbi:DUF6443 domain-containing protein [Chryseobacterium gwangjuense]|uniref:DUF6443 domain-containing protein n=1 Tax=Chryseobacterium gwangjuense TaxID=1069980 RepID=UPI001E382A97|nr:DUF6443 domain-containing protein [Chryseobacterium gwangjuense]MCE3074673.1 RHS repeat-associated core domain-containing protein [Chryseobacterium gwangjuense]